MRHQRLLKVRHLTPQGPISSFFTPLLTSVSVNMADIERYSDRYKLGGAKGGPSSALLELHVTRKYNPALHPPQVFEAVIEKKKRPKGEGQCDSLVSTKAPLGSMREHCPSIRFLRIHARLCAQAKSKVNASNWTTFLGMR